MLAAVCVLRIRQEQGKRSKSLLIGSAAIIVLIAAHELYWIILPRFPADRAAYLSSLLSLKFLVSDDRVNLPLPGLLQQPPTAFEPRRHDTRSSLLQPAAPPLGSLTPAEAPIIDAEILFRQPGPPQNNTSTCLSLATISSGL